MAFHIPYDVLKKQTSDDLLKILKASNLSLADAMNAIAKQEKQQNIKPASPVAPIPIQYRSEKFNFQKAPFSHDHSSDTTESMETSRSDSRDSLRIFDRMRKIKNRQESLQLKSSKKRVRFMKQKEDSKPRNILRTSSKLNGTSLKSRKQKKSQRKRPKRQIKYSESTSLSSRSSDIIKRVNKRKATANKNTDTISTELSEDIENKANKSVDSPKDPLLELLKCNYHDIELLLELFDRPNMVLKTARKTRERLSNFHTKADKQRELDAMLLEWRNIQKTEKNLNDKQNERKIVKKRRYNKWKKKQSREAKKAKMKMWVSNKSRGEFEPIDSGDSSPFKFLYDYWERAIGAIQEAAGF